jgi:hypothetical protein
MDHIWDGFYTSQLRMARWPSIIQTGTGINKIYNVTYTGTAPSTQRFILKADSEGVMVAIKFTKAGSYAIYNGPPASGGTIVTSNAWDENLKAQSSIKGNRGCGENRYVGVVNIFEFYIRAECMLYVVPVDSITSSVRMSWTLAEFYAAGGTTKFVDRMAASLGIHASTIKVVAVYQGSVIVAF